MYKKQIIILILFLILSTIPVYSHILYPTDDFVEISKNAVIYEKKDILPITAFIGLSAILYWQDDFLMQKVHGLKSDGTDTTLEYAKLFGEGWMSLGLAAAFMISGETFLNRKYTFLGAYLVLVLPLTAGRWAVRPSTTPTSAWPQRRRTRSRAPK